MTYEQEVEITKQEVTVSAVCFEQQGIAEGKNHEADVHLFKRLI